MTDEMPELPPGYFWRVSSYFDVFTILELRKRMLLGSRQVDSVGIPALGWGGTRGGRGRYTTRGRSIVDYIDNDDLLQNKIREVAEEMLRKRAEKDILNSSLNELTGDYPPKRLEA